MRKRNTRIGRSPNGGGHPRYYLEEDTIPGQGQGFLTAPTATTPDDLRAFGTLQYLGTGAASGLGDAPENRLIDLVHALKAGHRQGASFVMNSATLAEVRKLRRVQLGPLKLRDLRPGQWRELFPKELAALKRAAYRPTAGAQPVSRSGSRSGPRNAGPARSGSRVPPGRPTCGR